MGIEFLSPREGPYQINAMSWAYLVHQSISQRCRPWAVSNGAPKSNRRMRFELLRAFLEEKPKSENPSFGLAMEGDGGGGASDPEREKEDESMNELLRDRFRLSTISIAETQAKTNGMEISEPIVACISDLAFKYTEQLAKDLELFAQHAGRKSVTTEDVILSAHRNDHLAASLRSLCNDLKAKEPQSERKRKKTSRKEDKPTTSALHIPDN